MSDLRIDIEEHRRTFESGEPVPPDRLSDARFGWTRRSFEPGESLAGRVSWRLDAQPASAELRLFWYTRGQGTEDVGMVDTVAFTDPQPVDDRQFRFSLPKEPYSFSGKLISVIWAVELIIEPGLQVERRDFNMSPSGREIQIDHEGA